MVSEDTANTAPLKINCESSPDNSTSSSSLNSKSEEPDESTDDVAEKKSSDSSPLWSPCWRKSSNFRPEKFWAQIEWHNDEGERGLTGVSSYNITITAFLTIKICSRTTVAMNKQTGEVLVNCPKMARHGATVLEDGSFTYSRHPELNRKT